MKSMVILSCLLPSLAILDEIELKFEPTILGIFKPKFV